MEDRIKELMLLPLKDIMLALKDETEDVRNEVNAILKTQRMEEHKKNLREYWNHLKPFKDEMDIPRLPNPLEQLHIDKLIECGALPKNKLELGKYYYGKCRNNDVAMWDGKEFKYQRCKFGHWYTDTINHFEDDNGFDLFVPLKEVEPKEIDIVI